MSLETKSVRVCGGVTYWTLGQTFDRKTLVDGFQALGLEDHAPEVRGPKSALSEAVREHYEQISGSLQKSEKVLFRGIDLSDEPADTQGLAAVLETLQPGGKNDYETLRIFKTSGDDGTIHVSPSDYDLSVSVNQLFRKHRQTVGQHSVARALVNSLQHFGGTALRPSGAIYFVEESKLEEWNKLAKVVQDATLEGASNVYLLRTLFDEEAVKAVRDAIVHEVRASAELIKDNAKKEGLKERAYRARRQEAQALHSRVSHYENLLGEVLSELHGVADLCEQEVVEAGLASFGDLFPTSYLQNSGAA